MSRDDVVFVRHDGHLRELARTEFASEDVLQSLIADHPHVLAGAQVSGDPSRPIRWLLVRREAGIPDSEGGAARWAVDHLLLDQDARPTFVEVKRSTDTRIRREVVGQMLDYAANATQHWPLEAIRDFARKTWGDDLDVRIRELIGEEALDGGDDVVEAWWQRAGDYLRRGEVRLLFVADVIPRELRAIVEFLNAQMPRVDVLGVEVSRYEQDGLEAYVPRVFGQTERGRGERAGASPTSHTDEQAFLASCPEPARSVFTTILRRVEARAADGWEIYWGLKGFSVRVPNGRGGKASLLYGYPPGANGLDVPQVQAYVAHVPPDRSAWARERFERAGRFQRGGQHTLKLQPAAGFADAEALMAAVADVAGTAWADSGVT